MKSRDILEVQGVNAQGFGIIPKLVMKDKKLTIEAKAIYSYFCSYEGAIIKKEKIYNDLCISESRYYKHFNLLKDLGYIRVKQVRKEDSKFSYNAYTLVENPMKINREGV